MNTKQLMADLLFHFYHEQDR